MLCRFIFSVISVWVLGVLAAPAYAVAPTVSLAAPANGATYTSPASITLTATAADSDGTVSKVEFFTGTTLLNSDTTAPYSYTWSNVQPGAYAITAKATDNSGATATSAIANIAVGGTVNYIYDELGRVVGVVDQAGNSGAYSYDSVGNVLSITRKTSTQIALVEFTPNSGPVGTTVTLYGAGFSTTASQNTVKFNGTAAAVVSATTTTLVVQVPAGATTGAISVTNTKGTATSSTLFTVGTSLVPTIISFTPTVGPAGTAVAINGSKFETELSNNKVTFNGVFAALTSATATTIATSVPAATASGKITVSTPYGKAISAQDFFVPPSGFTAADIETKGRMSIGETKSFSIATPNKIGMVLFDGAAGQRISLLATNATMCPCSITILNPNGTMFAQISGNYIDAQMLSASGAYTIIIDPIGGTTGSITLALYNIVDVTGTIGINSAPYTLSANVPGQNARVTFSGTAGQVVSLALTGVSIAIGEFDIQKPDGTSIEPSWFGSTGGMIEMLQLPVSGTYTIFLNPYLASVGQMTLTLSTDITGTLTINALPYTLSMMRPGQNAQLSFSGVAGQIVSIAMTGITLPFGSTNIELRSPTGTLLGSSFASDSIDLIDAVYLPTTGVYSLTVNPNWLDVGQMALTLSTDITDTLPINAAPYTLNMARPGQNARLSFSGVAGQVISVGMSGVTLPFGSTYMELRSPTGTLLGTSFASDSIDLIDAINLPATGIYSLTVNPNWTDVGQMALTLSADFTDTLTINGAAYNLALARVGQNARLTFDGTAGQSVSVQISGVTVASSSVAILHPNGTVLATLPVDINGGLIDAVPLPVTGTYTIRIDPDWINTGSMTLALLAPLQSAIAVNGPAYVVNITQPGQNAEVSFNGSAGQSVSLWISDTTFAGAVVDIRPPGGGSLLGGLSLYPPSQLMDAIVLPVTGTYTIVVDPYETNTGSASLLLSGDLNGSMSINGSPYVLNMTRPGQNARITFTGTAGQIISLASTGVSIASGALTIWQPNGSWLTSDTISPAGGLVDLVQLPASGTYAITIDPDDIAIGSATLTLSTDATGTLSINGTAKNFSMTRPGQNWRVTFSGSAGQIINLAITNVTVPSSEVTILQSDGTWLMATYVVTSGGSIDALELPGTGTYTVWVDPSWLDAGSMTLRLTSP